MPSPNSQIWFNTTVAPLFGDEIKNGGRLRQPWLGFPGGDSYPITSHDLFTPHAPSVQQPHCQQLASHWRISPIFRRLTGERLTILTGVDRALNDNTATQRRDQILANVYAGGFLNYLNPTAFAQRHRVAHEHGYGTTYTGPDCSRWMQPSRVYFAVRERKTLECAPKPTICPISSYAGIRTLP
jgi:hypothetical protein